MPAEFKKQWQLLQKTAELGKVAHAYLFYGGNEIERRKIALEFIKLINCKSPAKNHAAGCGVCRSCLEIEKNTSPDFFSMEPQDGEIKISQIRELQSRMLLCSYSSPYKSAIINQAHLLNWEAQSAFLKLLEEPKGQTIFILSTEYPERLLPTIISRTERLRFYSVLGNLTKDKNSEKIISELLEISKKNLFERFAFAKKLADNPIDINKVLFVWLNYFREQILAIMNGQASSYSIAKIKSILNSIETTSFLLSTTNVSPRLALEILMLEL